nr:hypothetical protein [Pseudomonadota bacterium]
MTVLRMRDVGITGWQNQNKKSRSNNRSGCKIKNKFNILARLDAQLLADLVELFQRRVLDLQ